MRPSVDTLPNTNEQGGLLSRAGADLQGKVTSVRIARSESSIENLLVTMANNANRHNSFQSDGLAAERQASAGARDGVKGKRNDLAARAPLHAIVRRRSARAIQPQVTTFIREENAS